MSGRRRRSKLVIGGAAMLSMVGLGSSIVVPSPAVAGARGEVFRGHTSQHPARYGPQEFPNNEVTFRLVGGRVVDFTIPWVAPCMGLQGGPSAPLIDRSALDPLPLRRGRFDIRGAGYKTEPGYEQVASVQLEIHGRIRGRTATGTLQVLAGISVEGLYSSDDCFKKTIRWRAIRTRSPAMRVGPGAPPEGSGAPGPSVHSRSQKPRRHRR